jgi:hypothetical protein
VGPSGCPGYQLSIKLQSSKSSERKEEASNSPPEYIQKERREIRKKELNGSIHVESLNRNIMSLGVLESKWGPIQKKLVRRLLEEQDKVLGPISHKRGERGARGGAGATATAGEHVRFDMYV